MTTTAAAAAYKIWAGDYDRTPNALLALEMRILSQRLGNVEGQSFLDAGSGTGRWMTWAEQRGARVFGIDSVHEMALRASEKPGLAGRSALGDVRRIPVCDDAADIALCSFTAGYVESPRALFRELARVARRVVVSDLHPDTVRHGWIRSFRAGDELYRIRHYEHSAGDLEAAARAEGLTPDWRIEASFGEAERGIFQRAGKEDAFEDARRIPAVLITAWAR